LINEISINIIINKPLSHFELKEIGMEKELMAVGVAVVLIAIGLSGCESNTSNPTDNEKIKIMEISRMDVVQTISYSDKPLKLIVSGMDCEITVTRYTNLTEVVITGWYSVVRVSRSHSFTSSITGTNSQIIYYD
jgi:hypothetical protein